jgi:hypothetical protein
MGSKQSSFHKSMPFVPQDFNIIRMPYRTYLELAKNHLVTTVGIYKSSFGKNGIEQTELLPPEQEKLVWFL